LVNWMTVGYTGVGGSSYDINGNTTRQVDYMGGGQAAAGAGTMAAAGSAFGPWGAAIGGIAGGIAGLFGGGGETTQSGYTLPPEYELQYFQQMQKNFQQIQLAYKQSQSLYQIYNQRLETISKALQGTIPTDEALRGMTDTSMKLGLTLGMDAQTLAKNGYITASDQTQLEKMQRMTEDPSKYKNAATENDIASQKRQLLQQLVRSGASPAQQAQALALFEQTAAQYRQQATNTMVGQMGQNIQLGAGLRQQGFGQAVSAIGTMQGQIGAAQQSMGLLSSVYGGQYNAGQSTLQTQQGLRGEANAQFADLGKYQISDRSQAALESGLVGPGSYYTQTGISGSAMGNYRNWVATKERMDSAGSYQGGYSPSDQTTPEGYRKFRNARSPNAWNRAYGQPAAVPTHNTADIYANWG
jgi:hypothetical protein